MKEPDRNTRPPQPDRWNLTVSEIGEMLRRTGVEPWSGSPFLRLHGAGKGSPQPLTIADTPDIREATVRIGRPDIILGLLHMPPGNLDVTWFYGTSGDRRFAVHRRDGGLWHRIVWPVLDTTLVEIMETAVSLKGPAVTDSFALSLDRRGLEAAALIVDFLQEEILRAAMHRTIPSAYQFDIDDLFCCYQRSLKGVDLRWMVQRAKLVSPVALAPDAEGLRGGVGALVTQGMLEKNGSLYSATSRFAAACSLLAACNGFFALSNRRRVLGRDGENAWDLQHMAALRGVGSLWLFEFSDITTSDFTLKLGDVTPNLLHERIVAGVLPPQRVSVREEAEPAGVAYCRTCGATLQAAAKFCSNCGAEVNVSAEHADEAETGPGSLPPVLAVGVSPENARISCPKCGAMVASRNRFCTRCGSPLC